MDLIVGVTKKNKAWLVLDLHLVFNFTCHWCYISSRAVRYAKVFRIFEVVIKRFDVRLKSTDQKFRWGSPKDSKTSFLVAILGPKPTITEQRSV